jgi:hypothetical protein
MAESDDIRSAIATLKASCATAPADFFVVLKDGKVESFGSANTQKANRSTVILVH